MRDPPVRMTWQRAVRFRRRTLTDGWGVSIKPWHWRQNFEKPRLYVLITKNHDFSGKFFQFALIASWTWIDTESDRWDPPISAKLVLYVLTWTETHLSVQLKIKNGKMKKKQVIPNLYLPAGHPHRRHPAVGHHLQGGMTAPSQARRLAPSRTRRPHALTAQSRTRRPMVAALAPSPRRSELVAPSRLDIAARSSSPAGQEWGRGGDPSKMGQGEEICWRWTSGGDPPEMGQGEDSRRPAGVLGGGGAVASHRKKKTTPAFLFFYWADKWAPVQLSTNRIFFVSSALTGGSHLSDLVSISVQLAISVNWKKLPEKSWFFVIKT
jgi:hypothetical protein